MKRLVLLPNLGLAAKEAPFRQVLANRVPLKIVSPDVKARYMV